MRRILAVVCVLTVGFSLQFHGPAAVATVQAQAGSSELEGLDDFIAGVMKEWKVPGLAIAVAKDGDLLVVLAPSHSGGQDNTVEARVDSVFVQYDNTRSPGCALGVIQDGEFIFKRGYGMANLEYGISITPSSVFRIGSTSKQFTAAAVVQLAQEGKLALDDDIRMHLSELPDYGHRLTIRHLLHHTSGIRDYLRLMYLAGGRNDDFYTDQEAVAMVARQRELNFAPGEEYLYSNSGYFLLSQIVKRASGQSLREYAREKIFRRLGMSHSHFHDDHTHIVPNRAGGYAPNRDGGFRISMTTLGMVGDGGVLTSVEDLLHWDNHFYDRPAEKEAGSGSNEFWRTMLTRGVLNSGDTLDYALGLVHGTYRGLGVISHGGAFVGFRAQMMRFPTERFTVICLCNLSTANPSRLARQVADIYLADRLEPRATGEETGTAGARPTGSDSVSLSKAQLQEYVGDYYSEELDATYRIRLDGDTLALTVGNRLDGRLRPVDSDEMRRGSVRLLFQRDDGAAVTGFLLDAGRVKNLRFERR